MRVVQRILFVVLMSGLMAAQSSAPGGSDTSNLETNVQKLLDAMAAQQKAMAEQQKQISEQQQEIEKLKQQLGTQAQATSANADAQAGRMVNANITVANTNPAARTISDVEVQEKPKESPLSIRIGGAEFTPGGFVDFENIFRSTNTGGIASTGFGGIPFSNTVAGHLTEFHSTGQYSRWNMKVTDNFAGNAVTAYVEGDFNGNDAANVFDTSNPHTGRLRLFFVDLKRDKWEFAGGQTWGLMTPHRVGLGPMPSDLATTLNEDANIQVGIPYTRQSTFRVIWEPSKSFGWAFAVENSQQFTNGEVTFPTAFNAQLGTQLDAGATPGTPNVAPNLATKFAFDSNPGGHHFHFGAGGELTTFKITNIPTVAGSTFVKHSYVGGGIQGEINFELVKGFRLVGNALYGPGIGRYLIALAPDVVVLPAAAGTDVRVSPVHSGMGLGGVEWQMGPKTIVGAYYGGLYAQRNFALDNTAGAKANTFVGFGGPNSANNNNRAIQEATIDWQQTFWKSPQYGALVLITQASYVSRSPWFVAAGAPKNAHVGMGFLSMRYILP